MALLPSRLVGGVYFALMCPFRINFKNSCFVFCDILFRNRYFVSHLLGANLDSGPVKSRVSDRGPAWSGGWIEGRMEND